MPFFSCNISQGICRNSSAAGGLVITFFLLPRPMTISVLVHWIRQQDDDDDDDDGAPLVNTKLPLRFGGGEETKWPLQVMVMGVNLLPQKLSCIVTRTAVLSSCFLENCKIVLSLLTKGDIKIYQDKRPLQIEPFSSKFTYDLYANSYVVVDVPLTDTMSSMLNVFWAWWRFIIMAQAAH